MTNHKSENPGPEPDSIQETAVPPAEAKEVKKKSAFDIFSDVSGAGPETQKQFEELVERIGELPQNIYEAGIAIRRFFIKEGFKNDDNVFELQEVLKNRRGNCLSLTLLYGAILEAKGFEPKYEILLNPKGPEYRFDVSYFDRLTREGSFNYGDPKLCKKPEAFPNYFFAPLEHPRLILGDEPFESTNLEKEEVEKEPPVEGAELTRSVSYSEVASGVLLTRAVRFAEQMDKRHCEHDFKEIKNLIDKALELWPKNREAYALLFDLGCLSFDAKAALEARRRYEEFGGDDSRYYFNLFRMTENREFLKKAKEKFPAYVEAVIEQAKEKAVTTPKDARFDFAVASWCIGQSRALDLVNFYAENAGTLGKVFEDPDRILVILDGFVDERGDEFKFQLGMYDLEGDTSHLEKIINENLLPDSPYRQYQFYMRAQTPGGEYSEKFKLLEEKYAEFRRALGLETPSPRLDRIEQ